MRLMCLFFSPADSIRIAEMPSFIVYTVLYTNILELFYYYYYYFVYHLISITAMLRIMPCKMLTCFLTSVISGLPLNLLLLFFIFVPEAVQQLEQCLRKTMQEESVLWLSFPAELWTLQLMLAVWDILPNATWPRYPLTLACIWLYIYIDVRWVESHQSLKRKAIAAHLLSWDYSAACFAVKLSKIGSDIINSWPREGPVINQGWRPGICMESCKRTCIPDLAVLCWVPAPSGGGAHWRTPHGFIQGNALGSRQRQWYDEGATWIARKYLYSTLRPHCCECWRQPRKQTVDGIAWYYCICIWPHFHFKCHGKASQTFVFFGSSLSCLEITFARFGKCKSPTSGEWIQSIKCLDRCFCCTSLHCTQWNLKRLERMPSVT